MGSESEGRNGQLDRFQSGGGKATPPTGPGDQGGGGDHQSEIGGEQVEPVHAGDERKG